MLRVVEEFGRRKESHFLCSNVDLECYELWGNSGEEKKVMSILRTNKKTNTTERLTGYIPIIKLKKGFTYSTHPPPV